MTKRYQFSYQDGSYVLKYTNPNDNTEPFFISAENMQFDTKKFYEYVFSDIKEITTIMISNDISSVVEDASIIKKGDRVYQVINDLCQEIVKKINVECFGIEEDT